MLMKFAQLGLMIGILLLSFRSGYAMQPPPPPLNLTQLQVLIVKADIIVVGKVVLVKKTEEVTKTGIQTTVEVKINVEKLLKGKVSVKYIQIQESYPGSYLIITDLTDSKKEVSSGQIISTTAGPRLYHGKYKEGDRIIVFLKEIEVKDKYRTLGSGTYDKYLGEFLIEASGIKSFYFRFADDIEKYTRSEDEFIGLIKEISEKN